MAWAKRGWIPVVLGLGFVILGMAPGRAQTPTEVVLHNFGRYQGSQPYAGVFRDAEGNLYGTAYYGGPNYAGTIYKADTAGNFKVLYNFTGFTDGGRPQTGVVRDAAGNLYGTTTFGGASGFGGNGVVYKLDPAGRQTVMHSFTGVSNGSSVRASGVILDSAGNLYGTTEAGGGSGCEFGCGVVYKIDTAGNYTVLHNFNDGTNEGVSPYAGVIRDDAGTLYGTTYYGGAHNDGVVYKLDAAGNYTELHSFGGKGDGQYPHAGVTMDAAGNLYGTTQGGGTANHGVVYKLDPAGSETVLYSFLGGADGGNPDGGVVRDPSGNLYGTTQNFGAANYGVVFEVDPSGHETVLHTFTGTPDGADSWAGLVRDPAGNLFGTTIAGGPLGGGTVFKVDTSGVETVVHSFPAGTSGETPESGLAGDPASHLYGTTVEGGTKGAGVVYRLDPGGQYRVFYTFAGGADGGQPVAGVALDSAGNLYGTAFSGGITSDCTDTSLQNGCGVVYKIDPAGNETVLYSFTGQGDGARPYAGVVRDAEGNLYGTTYFGGTGVCFTGYFGCGVVYKIDAAGNYTVLHRFTGPDGALPFAGVIEDAQGNLYGTTESGGAGGWGVAFKMDTAGTYTVLHSFTGGSDGGDPTAGVIRDSDGNLYGTTYDGGITCGPYPYYYGGGVVYKLDASGKETVLYSFPCGVNGSQPEAGVVRDPAGNLYGTAVSGGTDGGGVVYKVDPSGRETVIYSFTCQADGCLPAPPLLLGASGNLFGTTYTGGTKGTGVVYEIKLQ